MGLIDLPVRPSYTQDRIRDTYIAELQKVTTPEELTAFVTRWKPLFALTKKRPFDKKAKDARRYRITQNNFERLLAGDYDPKVALDCIRISRTNACQHARSFSCPGMHIAVPEILLLAGFVAKKFGVSTDLALIQMNGGVGRLMEAGKEPYDDTDVRPPDGGHDHDVRPDGGHLGPEKAR